MMTKNLAVKAAALTLAAGIGSGCIEEDCAETYFLGTPQVAIENDLNNRVDSISLEFRTDQRPYVPPEHRGIPVGTNLSIYCAPIDRNGNIAESGCQDGKDFEFFISFIDSYGNITLNVPENWNGSRRGNIEDIELTGQPDLTVRCNVWKPLCAIGGRYVDEEGRAQYRDWGQRTFIGSAEAEVITEMLCPAPLSAFKPVDESEWRTGENKSSFSSAMEKVWDIKTGKGF